MAKQLEEYSHKRHFDKTSEPSGGSAKKPSGSLRFVVQHHIARQDHYDFRLEYDGVLKSWAVPKGPSLDTRDKRLAVRVEDHPLDYRNFEGTIPKGEYGGGTVMIWDEGTWEPLDEVPEGMASGSFKFALHGKRLKGRWALVHMKPRRGEKDHNWLLIKERDEYASDSKIGTFATSARTGRTMQEIAEEKHPSTLADDPPGEVLQPEEKNALSRDRRDFDDLKVLGVEISNPNKILFPRLAIRKGDVAEYYGKVASRMMPFLEDRLVSAVRCPKGIETACFYKKHPATKTEGVGMLGVPDKDNEKENYFYIKNAVGLMSEVQLNTVEFHAWGCKVDTLEKPDTMVFDLDPDVGIGLDQVRQGVYDIRSILDELELTCFLRTTGGKGYHVVIPFRPTGTWTAFKSFAHNIAKLMEAKWPDRYTSNSRKYKRQGRIYVDWQRNIRGATAVVPFSLRSRETAAVAMPIAWQELGSVAPDQISMGDALDRLHLEDPWKAYFEVDQELKDAPGERGSSED